MTERILLLLLTVVVTAGVPIKPKTMATNYYSGHKFHDVCQFISATCAHHPKGMNKGSHAPAL